MGIRSIKSPVEISISIVSHAQIHLIENLLHDIADYCHNTAIELILTLNLDETLPFAIESLPFSVTLLRNTQPKGFGANQNQAFKQAKGKYFCAVNPDIRIKENPFPILLNCLQHTSSGVVSPLVLDEFGSLEDCARRFPTPLIILCKLFGRCKGSDYRIDDKAIFPDWVAGMFMLFPTEIFKQLNGFDEQFFLYYEDVDICARLRLHGYRVAMCTEATVIHYAHRSSHQNIKYLTWHLKSMLRFFCSAVFLKIFAAKYKKICLEMMGFSDTNRSI